MKTTMRSTMLGMVALAMATTSAYAQPGSQKICSGQEAGPCAAVYGTIVAPWLADPVRILSAGGMHIFSVMSEGGNPFSTVLTPVSWTGTASDPILGAVQWRFSNQVAPTPSTFVSNQLGAQFPATGNLYFWIEGEMDAVPGAVLRSMQEVHLFSDVVQSYDPFNCELFSLVDPVDFEDTRNPGVPVFTLQALDVTLDK